MPYDKKTGKKVPYTKANMKKAAGGKGGLTMKKPGAKKRSSMGSTLVKGAKAAGKAAKKVAKKMAKKMKRGYK